MTAGLSHLRDVAFTRSRAARPARGVDCAPMALYWGFRIAALLARLAPLRVSYAVGRLGGIAAYYLWRGGRRRCVRNMLHVTGGDEALARKLARRSFSYYGLYLIDFLRLTSASLEELRRRVIFDDWESLERARDGNGVLFVTVHFGNWDLGAAALAGRGYPTSVIADSFSEPRLNELVLASRRHLGMQILPADRLSRQLLRALRDNEVVAALIDIPQGDSGVQVEFLRRHHRRARWYRAPGAALRGLSRRRDDPPPRRLDRPRHGRSAARRLRADRRPGARRARADPGDLQRARADGPLAAGSSGTSSARSG